MKTAFLLGFIPGITVWGFLSADNDHDLPLMITYFTWVFISLLYFINSILRFNGVKRKGECTLRYQLNSWFLFGAMMASGFDSVARMSSAILTIMYISL